MDIVKIGLLGILSVVGAIGLRQKKPEISLVMIICTSVYILLAVLNCFNGITSVIYEYFSLFNDYGKYLGILVKVIGITYICEFCAGVCKDAGYSTIGNQIELSGKLSVFLAGLPILLTLMDNIGEYFK